MQPEAILNKLGVVAEAAKVLHRVFLVLRNLL